VIAVWAFAFAFSKIKAPVKSGIRIPRPENIFFMMIDFWLGMVNIVIGAFVVIFFRKFFCPGDYRAIMFE